jgi:hypothetical protein
MMVEWLFPMQIDETPACLHRTELPESRQRNFQTR